MFILGEAFARGLRLHGLVFADEAANLMRVKKKVVSGARSLAQVEECLNRECEISEQLRRSWSRCFGSFHTLPMMAVEMYGERSSYMEMHEVG